MELSDVVQNHQPFQNEPPFNPNDRQVNIGTHHGDITRYVENGESVLIAKAGQPAYITVPAGEKYIF
jgi:hypothetical protein